jgi:dihydrofolate reductase
MITLDGVMQAPGGPEEDTSNGFEYGGWVAPFGDDVYNGVVKQEMQLSDYLLGRKTFKIWEEYWPEHAEIWPAINQGVKYVFSKTVKQSNWQHSVFIESIETSRA